MVESLFPEDEVPLAKVGMRERLLTAYAKELLDHPPVRSLDPAHEPDERRRIGESRRLAGKDLSRFYKCVTESGLEIGDAGRIARLKELLALVLDEEDHLSVGLVEQIRKNLGGES